MVSVAETFKFVITLKLDGEILPYFGPELNL